jgi:hypothetical protein
VRLLTIAVVLVLALAGASCGGDDETSGDTDDVTIETTTDETTTDDTTTDDDTTGSFASAECQELMSASSALGQAFAAAGGAGSNFDAAGEAFQEAVADAPEEIRADLEIIADAYSEYLEVVSDAGIEPGETPTTEQAIELSQALASIDVAEYSAASQRFSTWAAANCN